MTAETNQPAEADRELARRFLVSEGVDETMSQQLVASRIDSTYRRRWATTCIGRFEAEQRNGVFPVFFDGQRANLIKLIEENEEAAK